jgi:hypothetical protein
VEKLLLLQGQCKGMSVHEDVYKLCTCQPSHAERLYNALEQFVTEHVQRMYAVSCDHTRSTALG